MVTNGDSSEAVVDVDIDITPFVKLDDPSAIIPVLEKRLPKSCFLYNSAKMHPRFSNISSFYTLNGEIDESSWIVYLHYREDYGQDYLISADEERSKISKDEATKILSECKLFNWDESFYFPAAEKWLSTIIYDISVNIKGNATSVYPDLVYTMDREESLNLDARPPDPSVEIKRLDTELGLKFILDTWKYAIDGSETVLGRVLEKNESAGVYINGDPVCGLIVQGFGMISALYTLKEHRGKGYGKLCMQYAFKELAKRGFVPGSTAELRNLASREFHDKLGAKVAYTGDYIVYTKPTF